MKIVMTGGGSGGHFTPLLAVAREIRRIADEEKIVSLTILYIADQPFDPEALRMDDIQFIKISSGKMRRYASLWNIVDLFKTCFALLKAFWILYREFPDVVFSKGGFVSFPILAAARFYGIPVIIHESDSVPGRVNAWAAKFADRIAISFPETLQYFPKEKTAYLGNPIRSRILGGNENEGLALFALESHVPVILVLGGSQGAQSINTVFLQIVGELIETCQVIHQTGKNNYTDVLKQASVLLEKSPHRSRYRLFPFLTEDQLRNASHLARVIVSRAGAGAIFEIAAWGIPSILIPLPEAAADHQRHNAYMYARNGACSVIEESNLTPTVLLNETRKILSDDERRNRMSAAAQKFARIDAAEKIAREVILLGLHKQSYYGNKRP
ncbi:MAG: undecaprenyldiphospho-muramoylpentapeptide beta-N-acetylglucosaminyltransferase [Candidatus Ryanbacteria bacterium RIFCSPHIGHO2_02_FULL_45_17b]|uniref:UDP-N-acetylglucosamine--N-acetylmuramyl-(pentapeptide) pyrophosphoryl-undecaprenol N-acetylglucosamine transferase n=1 Tax=Candidatus Ryanbacteria bacterium RIFCSPHIGHO2_01_FULL_45_22 TaxID=1802114 RepID=A0A1G2G1W8_9BACT|nr:MAG: undecaprenyldiphospho-muramoylpentapeptide beta-N-acetylglucosaminyltransferase [Candidatus Ryanbacteria bacterium RIFCSPHIGHO2_01_FULL_45_22]OGZ46975.1 MAG: undecaprenyldiphospho-muramoylpentapeptide beta-N-acetylglucosaminyltransferase [Candidatus Ryanbacteria bacterium RIFCSPHIGHO2_02_FULL_45_17b]